jgi:aryl-alcohol dehydrogenase-like predicted oxidoreductase
MGVRMDSVRLGKSGLPISRLCLGTMIFGSQRDERAAFAVLDRAWELGIDFLDTADVYPVPVTQETVGRTEEILGRWLSSRSAPAVVATKCANRTGAVAHQAGGSRKHVIEACEASLRRLGRERVDIFYLHHSDLQAPLEETLEALDGLLAAGKFHYVGLSNFEAWQLGLALAIAGERRLAEVSVLQPRYNLLARSPERDLLPLCRARGIAVVPYNPLAAGMLTGKYRRGQDPPEGSRFALGDYGRVYRERYWSDRMFDVAEAVAEVGAEAGCTPAQVALAWLLSRPGVTAPIVGASRPEQLEDSVAAVGLELGAAHLDRLDRVSQPFL